MGTALAPSSHVHLDDQGRAWITGTTHRVLDVAADHVVYGFSPSEIQYQHYRDLTLAQIHAALAYYFDHRAELDEALKREALDVDRQKAAAGESPVVKRLRAEGKLP